MSRARDRSRRLLWVVGPAAAAAVTALLAPTPGCADAFGINDPALDSCAGVGACVDATAEASAPDAADGGTTGDATFDATTVSDTGVAQDAQEERSDDGGSEDAPATVTEGVRCGNGSLVCTSTAPYCCESFDGGSTAYECVVSASACSAYAIQCAAATDCPVSGNLCCHYQASTKCEPASTASCTGSVRVCDPNADGGCPPGATCTVHLQNGGLPSPYFGCSM